jgi:F0F1-type ATP synthase membrane subunit b/b'
VQSAQEEAVRVKQAAEKELADARAEARGITREAREQADALLREARAQVDLSAVESRALSEAVRDAQHRLRELSSQITSQLQAAQKDLNDRTSLHSVQARVRAGGNEGSAVEIAEHLGKILRGTGSTEEQ